MRRTILCFSVLLTAACVPREVVVPAQAADPPPDTVWWKTDGGRVVQARDSTEQTCSLMVYNRVSGIVFRWQTDNRILVGVTNSNWQFQPDAKLQAVIRIGGTSLNSGSTTINNAKGGAVIEFFLDPSTELDHLLMVSEQVEVTLSNDADVLVPMIPAKMPALMSALRKCRTVIGHKKK